MSQSVEQNRKIKKDLVAIISLIVFFTLLFVVAYIYNQKTGQLNPLASNFYHFLLK